jgi:hypothetical protein
LLWRTPIIMLFSTSIYIYNMIDVFALKIFHCDVLCTSTFMEWKCLFCFGYFPSWCFQFCL